MGKSIGYAFGQKVYVIGKIASGRFQADGGPLALYKRMPNFPSRGRELQRLSRRDAPSILHAILTDLTGMGVSEVSTIEASRDLGWELGDPKYKNPVAQKLRTLQSLRY